MGSAITGGSVAAGGASTLANKTSTTEKLLPYEFWNDPDNTGDWYPYYLKRVNLGSLPNSTSKSVAHGISNPHLDSIEINGLSTNGTAVNPLPYVHTTTSAVVNLRYLDSTNVLVQTATNYTAYTGYIFIKFAKTTDSPVAEPA